MPNKTRSSAVAVIADRTAYDVRHLANYQTGTDRNIPVWNTLVQLLALYTNPESHNAQRHRQTDDSTPIADHTV